MTLDSKSLEKLSSYSKKLTKTSPESNRTSKRQPHNNHKLHPIETEEDPIKLFQELIKASSNGEVPAHLIKRLKELEGKKNIEGFNPDQDDITNLNSGSTNNLRQSSTESELYTAFKMLLLEED